MKATATTMALQAFLLSCLALASQLPDLIAMWIAISIGKWVSPNDCTTRIYAERNPAVAELISRFGLENALILSSARNFIVFCVSFALIVVTFSLLERKMKPLGYGGKGVFLMKLSAIVILLLNAPQFFYADFRNIFLLPPEMVAPVFYPAIIFVAIWLFMVALWAKKTRWEIG